MERSVEGLNKFDSLQVFRGIAALSVAAHHTESSVAHFVGGTPTWFDEVCNYGYLGVDFFFVLSGFIIMSSHMGDDKSGRAFANYGFKRFIRIFPSYWPISIALLLGYTFLPALSAGTRTHLSLLSSFLLLPDSYAPAVAVAWTLIHEVMFYSIFCLFFVSNRLFIGFVILWVASIGFGACLLDRNTLSPWLQRFLHPVNLEFVMGIGVAFLTRRTKSAAALPLLYGGIILLALLIWAGFTDKTRVPFGVPFAAIILGAVLFEINLRPTFPRWLVLMGDASYAIYLIHDPLVGLTSRLVVKLGLSGNWVAGMILGVGASIATGLFYHLTYEKPVLRLLRKSAHLMPAVETA